MPYYEYECPKCKHETEIIKSISNYDRDEPCGECGELMDRLISKGHFLYAEVQEAYFNHGLGCVVKNRQHKAQLVKERGLVEMGNDRPKDKPNHNPYELD
jgi:putative FmdB family regulatory protein